MAPQPRSPRHGGAGAVRGAALAAPALGGEFLGDRDQDGPRQLEPALPSGPLRSGAARGGRHRLARDRARARAPGRAPAPPSQRPLRPAPGRPGQLERCALLTADAQILDYDVETVWGGRQGPPRQGPVAGHRTGRSRPSGAEAGEARSISPGGAATAAGRLEAARPDALPARLELRPDGHGIAAWVDRHHRIVDRIARGLERCRRSPGSPCEAGGEGAAASILSVLPPCDHRVSPGAHRQPGGTRRGRADHEPRRAPRAALPAAEAMPACDSFQVAVPTPEPSMPTCGLTALPLPVLTAPRADHQPPAYRADHTRVGPIEPCVCGQTSRASPAASNARSSAIPARRRAERRRCPPSPREPDRSRRRPGPVTGRKPSTCASPRRRRYARRSSIRRRGPAGERRAAGLPLPTPGWPRRRGPRRRGSPPARAPRASWPATRAAVPRGGLAGPAPLAPRRPGHPDHAVGEPGGQGSAARVHPGDWSDGAVAVRVRRRAAVDPLRSGPPARRRGGRRGRRRTRVPAGRRGETEESGDGGSLARASTGPAGPRSRASSYRMRITITGPHAVSRMLPMA